ncbi:beta-ketoacyl-ACP synthase III [Clostridium folliculivorans]|uniref:Beta-ketoacyl-[acyl-carrier-protein] synthase III n=1 Tax=Clostridium folliculivorans TaxID=2886038 RepID=A0A9W6DAY0_9CLOT|nr:beta-ketoacyl-ACP synthase III [Clostridium folliculivorans]GKU25709.1 3-oxoacyl-[acyl-carrier-protein] synthase 3 [Clostridium folliculivorans]GKU28731.1 3-oxoacyl-[acyl-carrier-protein] synthase 3 [Clostridium folliculivorans]
MIYTKIISTGSYAPNNIVTNDDLSKIVETDDQWISSRTGIRERRISLGENTSALAAKAGLDAINNAGLTPMDIDLLIVATTTPDSFTPSTACIVQDIIGAKKAYAFDVSAACSGFIYAISVADKIMRAGEEVNALVIGAETLSRIVNWNDRSTCVLFGDGAGAVVLKKTEEKGIISSVLGSDGTLGRSSLTCGEFVPKNPYIKDENQQDEIYINMDGKEIFRFAVNKIPQAVNEVLAKAETALDEVKLIFPHQANLRIVDAAAKKLDLPKEKFYVNLNKYGNTSAASIPLALDEANRNGLLQQGDKLVLVGFGGGLTWGSIFLQW